MAELRAEARLIAWWHRNWLAACALATMVASEYKWRIRGAESALSGQADLSTLLELAVYCLVGGYLLHAHAVVPRLGRTAAPFALLVGYVGYLSLSVGWSPFRSVAAVRAVETVIVLLLCWVVIREGDRSHLHRAAHGFTALVAASVGLGLAYRMPRLPGQQSRFTWLMVHPTSAGVFLGIAVLIGVTYLLQPVDPGLGISWPRQVHLGLVVVNLGGLLASQTRGAVIGLVVALPVLALVQRPLRRRVTTLVVLTWAAALGLLIGLSAITAYLARGEPAAQLETLNARTDLWSVAATAVAHEPLYGYGLYASRGIFIDSTGLGGGHNALVNVAVDLGATGTAIWLAMIAVTTAWLLRSGRGPGWRAVAPDRSICLVLLVFFVVDGVSIADIGAVSNVGAAWLFLIVSWSVVIDRDRRKVVPHGV